MRVVDVKNTIHRKLLEALIPHYCTSCDKIGSILCASCKNDIEMEFGSAAIVIDGCVRVWTCGERTDTLAHLIDVFKFNRRKDAANTIASLMALRMGELPADVHIVPIPTIAKHIRQRGYDHTELIARALAERGGTYSPALRRLGSDVQVGANRMLRKEQADRAFEAVRKLNGEIYLLVDDVTTTGATLAAAARVLTSAGAGEVWAIVLAKQPLEKK